MPQDPGLEDRERLERFLEWRRADDESRKTARRHTAGMATLAVAVAALITAAAWYAIDGHRRAALTHTAKPDARVALAPGVDTGSNQKLVSPAPLLPLSRPESERGDSDVAASSAQATPPEATPAERTPAEATPAPAEATSSLATSAAPPMPLPPAVAGPRAAARLESRPPRRSARVVREAGRVPAAPTTPDVAASRPPEPAPIAATPVAPPPDVAASRPPEPAPIAATPVAPPPPAVVPDTPRATVPPANAESVRSEPSKPVAAPPITASPATRTEDAAAAVSRPAAPQTASIRSDAAASVAEPPARLAPPAPPSTGQVLKEWAGYIPEVRLARAIYRWAKKQPPPDGTRPEEPQSPQAR
jgi:hypothetical protein